MQCDFLLPGLFGAPNSHGIKDIAPALWKLLARGNLTAENFDSTESWIAHRFALASSEETQALAAIALLGEKQMDPGTSFWLRADPVHLSINRDRVVLLDSSQLEITAIEAATLCLALQNHFAGDGLKFHAVNPKRWYIQSAKPIAICTHPPSAVRGHNVANYGFDGADRPRWQTRLSEMQMLLHAHPVNDAREAAGQLPINGVWLWGAGALPAALSPGYSDIVSDDPLFVGLARLCKARSIGRNEFHWRSIQGATSGLALIVLDQLDTCAAYGEWEAWRDALGQLDRTWFQPALTALQGGSIKAATVHAPDPHRGAKITINRYDLRKFWRRGLTAQH